MLPAYLVAFNDALKQFQEQFPKEKWTDQFKDLLLNDFSYFSSRIEDPKLQYGDTIRFLNNEIVRGGNLTSLLGVSEHQAVLKNLISNIEEFELVEEKIKEIHRSLMDSPLAWEDDFRPELVGNYRNIPIIGSREPLFENKEYAPHYNLEIIMSSSLEIFNNHLRIIDNSSHDTHLINRLAFFHNKFLNEIHPFADGNGRVCRIIMAAIMMKNDCPPIFPPIIEHEQQVAYITKIVDCETQRTNEPLIMYFAQEMTRYLEFRITQQ